MGTSTPLTTAIKNTTAMIYTTNLYKNTSFINALIIKKHPESWMIGALQTPYKKLHLLIFSTHYIFILYSSWAFREFEVSHKVSSPSLLTTEMWNRLRLWGSRGWTLCLQTRTQTPGQCWSKEGRREVTEREPTPSPPLTACFDSSKSEEKSVSMIIFRKPWESDTDRLFKETLCVASDHIHSAI